MISPRMKSTPRAEVCCPLVAGAPQGIQNQCLYFKMLHTHFKNTHMNPFFDQKSAVFKNKFPIFKNKSAVQKWTVEQVGAHPWCHSNSYWSFNEKPNLPTLISNSFISITTGSCVFTFKYSTHKVSNKTLSIFFIKIQNVTMFF